MCVCPVVTVACFVAVWSCDTVRVGMPEAVVGREPVWDDPMVGVCAAVSVAAGVTVFVAGAVCVRPTLAVPHPEAVRVVSGVGVPRAVSVGVALDPLCVATGVRVMLLDGVRMSVAV